MIPVSNSLLSAPPCPTALTWNSASTERFSTIIDLARLFRGTGGTTFTTFGLVAIVCDTSHGRLARISTLTPQHGTIFHGGSNFSSFNVSYRGEWDLKERVVFIVQEQMNKIIDIDGGGSGLDIVNVGSNHTATQLYIYRR